MNRLESIIKENKERDRLMKVFKDHGFIKYEVPYFHKFQDYVCRDGRLALDQTVKVFSNMGGVHLLRPDVSCMLMEEVSSFYRDPLKLFYDTETFENHEKGLRTYEKIGGEYYGDSSFQADLDMIKLGLETLSSFPEHLLVVGNSRYLDSLLEENVHKDKGSLIRELVRQKQVKSLEDILETEPLDLGVKEKLLLLAGIDQGGLEDLRQGYNTSEMLDALDQVARLSKNLSGRVSFDLSLVSHLDYYHGLIFKGYLKGQSKPVLKGGRYDKLSHDYGVSLEALGFSLDFDRIKEVLND